MAKPLDPPSQNECFNPPSHTPAVPTYSHISRIPISPTHTLISLAGQIGRDSRTHITPPTFIEQVKISFANVDKCLDAVGATKADIVQVRQYIVDLLRGGKGVDPEYRGLYAEWMGGCKPPSTVLGVQCLAAREYLFEIEVVCVVRNRDS
ncbi:YjgF-like protein [Lophiostoma macrostomum CBS 122681]|uniref:YjgF-like protein n=1 Tax=Lophiostoma macrostomum CBS 122681 TaxID=1314788 RepID=A0A6A6SXG7_9PLEO|nr:YjgF-like protein [Lophiostoma macrostomum CBS 122681]